MAADRSVLERSDLVLACAPVWHSNGQSTHETVRAAEWLGTQIGLRATMIAHWEELACFERSADAIRNSNILGRLGAHGEQSKH